MTDKKRRTTKLGRFHQSAIDRRILKREPLDVLGHTSFRDVLEPAVDDPHVLNRRGGKPAEIDRVSARLTRDTLQLDVARDWGEWTFVSFLIEEIDREHGVRNLPDRDVAHV